MLRSMNRTWPLMGVLGGLLLASWSSQAAPAIIFPLDIKFDTDQAVIKTGIHNDKEFKKLTQELKNYPYSRVEIQGYTDSLGSDLANQKLSEARAEAVRQRFIQGEGIAADRIQAVGLGETKPAMSNKNNSGRSQNRRVIARIIRLEANRMSSNGNRL
jgi:OmpA-OmpF porin, OOP family